MLNRKQVQGLANASVLANNCTEGWKQIGNLCYRTPNVTQTSVTMAEAQTVCEQEGGNVPSFHSMEEWDDFNTMR